MNAEEELNEKLKAIVNKDYFDLKDFEISKAEYYFRIFGEAFVIFLMYVIPLGICFLAGYGLYKLVTG
ncbi:MAG: hypothetical protein IPL26_29965 [Leptospiraceae bacterium]|nr:hypothetical protein [Leptospiraceae bacterium]